MLERLFYVSRMRVEASALDVQRILYASTMRNRRLDVTGMLTHTGQHFAQVLEGRTEAIDELMASVARDERHDGLRVLMRMPIKTRDYPEWSMGFVEGFGASETIASLFVGTDADPAVVAATVRKLFQEPAL
jgi:hypothetical protein